MKVWQQTGESDKQSMQFEGRKQCTVAIDLPISQLINKEIFYFMTEILNTEIYSQKWFKKIKRQTGELNKHKM